MYKKLIATTLFIGSFWAACVVLLHMHASHPVSEDTLPTLFTYSDRSREELRGLSSEMTIDVAGLERWDLALAEVVDDPLERLRLFTYLYVAQREGAFLSYNVHDYEEGSLDPLALRVVRLFAPQFPKPEFFVTDPYSEKLADVVYAKLQKRYEIEKGLTYAYKKPEDLVYWQGQIPKGAEQVAQWIPWVAKPLSLYLPPAPPKPGSRFWEEQLAELKRVRRNLTQDEVALAKEWSSGERERWRSAVNDYIEENEVALAQALLARSALMMGLYDTTIVETDAKYTYGIRRPFVADPKLQVFGSVPTTPSYPSGHAMDAVAAETILVYYFPDEAKEWKEMASEEAESRLWAGVHYPIDVEAGKKIGYEIGCEVVHCEKDESD